MTATRQIEYHIARQLLRNREALEREQAGSGGCPRPKSDPKHWADRVIAILAVTAALLVVGSYAQELLWAMLGFATVYSLR